MPSGNDFTVVFVFGEGVELAQNSQMIVAFYSPKGELLYSATLDNGIVFNNATKKYLVHVSHEHSATMVGDVKIEVTTIEDGVEHAPLIYIMPFEPRQNNALIH